MKRLLPSIAAATALFAPCAASAVEIYGVWARDGHPTDKLEFFDCSGKLCAKGVLPMRDGSPPPLVLRQAAKIGPNSWKGDLYNPEDGKTYTGKITYDSTNQLTLSGCLVAFLCQSETWTRVSGPTKAAAPADKGAAKASSADSAKDKDKTASKPATQDAARAARSTPSKPAPAKPIAPKSGDDGE
ncbi:MAG: DUF2147 domain-containing protein [Methylocystis sp.]|jgi:uncharacterized protein (DUF2147 family)